MVESIIAITGIDAFGYLFKQVGYCIDRYTVLVVTKK